MNKKLVTNFYRYGKILVISMLVAAFCYFITGYAMVDNRYQQYEGLIWLGRWVALGVSGLFAMYTLISFFVNRAVFGTDSFKYRTIIKNYKIKYAEIMDIDGVKNTTYKRGTLLRTVKYTFKVTTKTGIYKLNSHEFWGLAKAMGQLHENLHKDEGENENG